MRTLQLVGGQTIQAPVLSGKPRPQVSVGARASLGEESRQGARMRRSHLSDTPQGWWIGHPSAGRPSETTEQGVLRAPRAKVRGQRARAWTPCSSSKKGIG